MLNPENRSSIVGGRRVSPRLGGKEAERDYSASRRRAIVKQCLSLHEQIIRIVSVGVSSHAALVAPGGSCTWTAIELNAWSHSASLPTVAADGTHAMHARVRGESHVTIVSFVLESPP